MYCTFDPIGNLILHPSDGLERMAAEHFCSANKRRTRPEVIVEGTTIEATRAAAAAAASLLNKDVPGQQSLLAGDAAANDLQAAAGDGKT